MITITSRHITPVARIGLMLTFGLISSSTLMAASRYGFETANTLATTDGLVLTEQYRPASAFRFSRADGGSVTIAKTGAPYTAFGAGTDTASPAAGDALLPTDPWAAECGDSFFKLPGTAASALIITLDYPTAAASGLLLDIDADET